MRLRQQRCLESWLMRGAALGPQRCVEGACLSVCCVSAQLRYHDQHHMWHISYVSLHLCVCVF